MNILIISQSLSGGGAEKVAANLSLELSKYNKVYLLTYKQSNKEFSYDGERINISSDGVGTLARIYQFFRRIWIVKSIKKTKEIDYSISFVPQCDYANVLSYNKTTTSVVEVSSNMSVAFPGGISKLFRRFILKRADRVAVVSKGSEFDLKTNWGIDSPKLRTIYNSIDIESIRKDLNVVYATNPISGDYIVAMGSFRKPKGHWHLIKAFASIKKEVPNLKLVILGDGSYRSKYEVLIEKFGLKSNVIMPGFVDKPFSIISQSQMMVFPSIYEGFGNAIIEAMICKVPVIAADCNYGPREIIAPTTNVASKAKDIEICDYGIIIPEFDQSDIDTSESIDEKERLLGEAILKLYNDKELQRKLVEKAYTYCAKFDNGTFADQWLSFLKESVKR